MNPRFSIRALLVFSTLGLLAPLRADDPPAPADDVEGEAMFKSFVAPVYPPEALKAKRDGRVDLDFAVDENGNVTDAKVVSSSDPMFEEPALEAVKQWKFEPGVSAGKPVAMGMSGPVVFSIARLKDKKPSLGLPPMNEWPHASRRQMAEALSAPDPDYPDELAETKLPGQVNLEFNIDAEGKVSSCRVLWASHGAFVAEALRISRYWKFKPAHQGILAVPAVMRSPVTFGMLGARPAQICAANGLRLEDEASVSGWPEPIVMQEPVYPRARLLAHETGTAEAKFTIDVNGRVDNYTPGEASAPEFAQALAAATEAWLFRPATRDGSGVPVRVIVKHEFRAPDDSPLERLAIKLREGSVGSAKGLDAPLQVLWRGFPIYPIALKSEKPAGDAVIEIVIDHDGRVRAPEIISATRPEFGWAAATAVNQWVFMPPLRGGAPTEVRARVPLHFTAGE